MTTYNIRKLRAGRIADENPATWVGQLGTIFYDEATGALRISDGVTPGGVNLPIAIATTTSPGGIKAGPGANVSVDGTLSIDTAGLPLGIGNLSIVDTTISTVNANADLTLASNGTGNVELLGNIHFHTTASGGTDTPFFNASSDGQITILVPAADPLAGAVKIVGSTTGRVSPPLNTGVMLQLTGNNNDPSRLYNDSIGAFSAYVGRRINGNLTVPTAVQAGDEIIRISSTGHDGNTVPGSGSARILYQAKETYTTSAAGTNLSIWTTAVGSTVLTKTATFDRETGLTINGGLSVSGNIIGNSTATTATVGTLTVSGNAQAAGANIGYITLYNNAIYSQLPTSDITIGQLAATANVVINRTTTHNRDVHINTGNLQIGPGGTVYTPRVVYTNAGVRAIQDGIWANLQFGVDSIVHMFNPSGDVTVNFNTHTAGAQITLIISMDTRRAINYGVQAARNSTTGATSIPSTSLLNNQCVQLTYTCVDGTLANTYVAVSRV